MENTNFKRSETSKPLNYEKGKVYRNTDEDGHVNIIILMNNIPFFFQENDFRDIKEAVLAGEEPTPLIAEEVKIPEGQVSENFALRMVAIVLNKEKMSEV